MTNLKILVPLDHSQISDKTVTALIALKDRITRPLTLLHVLALNLLAGLGFPEATRAEFEKRVREEAAEFLAGQQELFTAAGMEAEILVKEGHARDLICQLADNGDYDLLTIGRNPVGEIRDLLFGQVANFVIHKVKCPVLII